MSNLLVNKKTMKTFAIIVLVISGLVILSAVGTGLNLITIPWLQFNSQIQTNRDIVTKTYNADNALYNYHWFRERATSITALDKTITQSQLALTSFEMSAGARSTWSFDDKQEDNRLRTTVLGQQAQYNNLVGEYNARAGEVDRSIFQNGLPLFFNLKNI